MIQFHLRRREDDSCPHFLLTPRDFDGKQSITVDDLRQRRFMHRTIENPDDEVLNQENLAEGFFFAKFLPLTFGKFRSSPKPNEGLKTCHDRGMNLDASARR